MNSEELHHQEKEVSAINLFKGGTGMASATRLSKDGILKEHITKVPTLLLRVKGRTVYNDAGGQEIKLFPGDYVHNHPGVKHRLNAFENSQHLLFK